MSDEERPLVLYTNAGMFACSKLTPESVSAMISKSGVLILLVDDTCRVEPVEPPPGTPDQNRIMFRYQSIASAEETEKMYLPASAVNMYFYSHRMPPMSVFNETVEAGRRKLQARKSNIIILERDTTLTQAEADDILIDHDGSGE